MSRVTFEHPVANISGRLSSRSNIILRTRNGKTQAYVIQRPYKGPIAKERQRTINAFREAVNQSKTILADAQQKADWQKRFNKHKDYFRRHPRSTDKRYSTLRGFVIAMLAQQINAQARQEQVAENQVETAQATVKTQVTASVGAAPTTSEAQASINGLFGDIVHLNC